MSEMLVIWDLAYELYIKTGPALDVQLQTVIWEMLN